MANAQEKRKLFIDITNIANEDVKTGIQRVVRSIGLCMIKKKPDDWDMVFVRSDREKGGYVCAKEAAKRVFGHGGEGEDGLLTEPGHGDAFLGLDLFFEAPVDNTMWFKDAKEKGMRTFFLVHDLIAVNLTDFVHPDMTKAYKKWIAGISSSDGLICVSKHVSEELREYLQKERLPMPGKISWFHHGSDMEQTIPTFGIPPEGLETLARIKDRPTFLMVGTIEPRKGHRAVFEAFERLWGEGVECNLVFVFQRSWDMEDFLERIRTSEYLNRRFFLLNAISDEYLEEVYSNSQALIMASEAEGFGLPIVEGAKRKLPLVLHDIPVFREIAGENAFYFQKTDAACIHDAIVDWLELSKTGSQPKPNGIPLLTWDESVDMFLERLDISGKRSGGTADGK